MLLPALRRTPIRAMALNMYGASVMPPNCFSRYTIASPRSQRQSIKNLAAIVPKAISAFRYAGFRRLNGPGFSDPGRDPEAFAGPELGFREGRVQFDQLRKVRAVHSRRRPDIPYVVGRL